MNSNALLHKQFDITPSEPAPPKPVLDVVCPHCFQSWLETTDRFDPKALINMMMFRLKDEYRAQGQTFCDVEIPTDSIEGDNVICPNCSDRLCDSDGRFSGRTEDREPEEKPKPFTCDICGEGFEKAWQKAVHAKKTGHKKVRE